MCDGLSFAFMQRRCDHPASVGAQDPISDGLSDGSRLQPTNECRISGCKNSCSVKTFLPCGRCFVHLHGKQAVRFRVPGCSTSNRWVEPAAVLWRVVVLR